MGSPATRASSSNTTILSIPINEKLTKINYTLWRAQVLPARRASRRSAQRRGSDAGAVSQSSPTLTRPRTRRSIRRTRRGSPGTSRLSSFLAHAGDATARFAVHHRGAGLEHLGQPLLIADQNTFHEHTDRVGHNKEEQSFNF
jgi:hypothetical protein